MPNDCLPGSAATPAIPKPTERSVHPVFKRSRLSLILSCVLSAFIGFMLAAHAQAPAAPALDVAAGGPPFTTDAAAQAAEHADGTWLLRLQSLLGLAVFTLIAYVWGQLRTKRAKVNWHTVFWGLVIQFVFAILVLDTGPGKASFKVANDGVNALIGFAAQGSSFVFGDLVKGGNVPVGVPAGDPLNGPILSPTSYAHVGAYFAFNVLPTIIFFSALSTLLYHLGILQWVVQGLAWVMQKTMRTSGAETLSSAANIFLGQTEAPLLVKPFIAGSTNSELMAIMVGGFANIASGVLAAYVAMLHGFFPDIAGHLLAASLISAPSSLVIAKLLLPETETPETAGGVKFHIDKIDANAVDASARGALEGLGLTLNVGAVLIVFIALVAMLNAIIGGAGHIFHIQGLSFEKILGWIATPFCWLMGISWHDAVQVGPLLGIKTAINEFLAYFQLSQSLGQNPHYISPRAAIITAYALCGFANFSSVAIQIGGIAGMAPNRRGDLSRLGLTAMWGGALSSFMTACVVGILL